MNPRIMLGLLALVLGGIGVVLPLLPTTPFVLLAGWCFARSSPRLHALLHRSELFGPILRDWEQRRCIPRRARILALASMALVGGASLAFAVPAGWPRWSGAGLLVVGCITVLSIPGCPGESRGRNDPGSRLPS